MEYEKTNVDPKHYLNYIKYNTKLNTLLSHLPADNWCLIDNIYYFILILYDMDIVKQI